MENAQQATAAPQSTAATAINILGYIPSRKARCANIRDIGEGKVANCGNDGTQSCNNCHLVSYCSSRCKALHQSSHEKACTSALGDASWTPFWAEEGREPDFGDDVASLRHTGDLNSLWGNMPAFDVLNISRKEGQDYRRDLDLCFVGE
ncbi:MAG: hypothetical protein Q9191_002289 [Dirinaria sp. TL-2023a]